MSEQFIRVKNYLINLDNLAYILIEKNHIDFGFAFHSEKLGGENYIRLGKGSDLEDAEFEQLKDFLLHLPDPDRVIII
jgi:hypothetical protein